MKAFELPPHIVKLIDETQRRELGLKTQEEHLAAAEIKSERDLHKTVGNLLCLRGIEFFESRMDKRTTTQVGMPDFCFCVLTRHVPTKVDPLGLVATAVPIACGWECKVQGRQLTEEQQAMLKRLTTPPNGWHCAVIRSCDDALAELKRLGL